MADNDSIARKFARVLADPESNTTEVAEARADLEILANRGSIFAREVLEQFPVVQVHTESEQPVLGTSPALAAVLADIDAREEANRLERIRVAPIRAERRAALEAAFTSHGVPQSWHHGYRRRLEIYQESYSFSEETRVFGEILEDIATRWKNAPKRV